MKKLALAIAALVGLCSAAHAQSTPPLASVVTACGTPPSTYTAGQNRPITQDTNGLQCTGATVTPSGTTDVNLKQVNGATVNVGAGAAGTGTQRVTTSTDSTIGTVTSVTSATVVQPTGTNLHTVVDSAVGVAQGSTTSGQTLSPIGCRTLTAAPTDTTAQTNMPWCRTNGALATDIYGIGGTAISTSNPMPAVGSYAQGSTTSGQTGMLQYGAAATSPPTTTTGNSYPLALDTHGAQRIVCQDTAGTVCDFTSATLTIQTSQYPSGATPIGGNSTGTTGSVVGTLAGTGGKTTYICGFNVSATGGVATLGPIVVAGLKTASQTYQLFSTATGAILAINYGSVCIPASAVNTAITVTTTADGTATAVDVNSWGYQL